MLLEPTCGSPRPRPGGSASAAARFLNLGVQVAAVELVEIGEHCMFANGCFVTDGNHRFDDPDKPVTWQGFTSKGPTRIGDNVWCGANVVVTSGVTIGERCVIGANSVVTTDLPPFSHRRRRARPRAADDRRTTASLRQHDLHAEHDADARRRQEHAPPARRRRPPRRVAGAARLGRAPGAQHDERERRR